MGYRMDGCNAILDDSVHALKRLIKSLGFSYLSVSLDVYVFTQAEYPIHLSTLSQDTLSIIYLTS